jgi:hypothetical protein
LNAGLLCALLGLLLEGVPAGQYRLSIGDLKGAREDLDMSIRIRPRPELGRSLDEVSLKEKQLQRRPP